MKIVFLNRFLKSFWKCKRNGINFCLIILKVSYSFKREYLHLFSLILVVFLLLRTEGLEMCALQEFLSSCRQLLNFNKWIVIFVAQKLGQFRHFLSALFHFESYEFLVEIFSLDHWNSSLVLKSILDQFSKDGVQHERNDINFLLLDRRHLFRVELSHIYFLELSNFGSKSIHDPDAFIV